MIVSLAGTGIQCFDDPVLTADGTTVLCAGSAAPRPRNGATPRPKPTAGAATTGPLFPPVTSTVTYGFAEFSATTGKFTRLLAPMTTDSTNSTSPRLMWVSPERTALIGVLTGPVFALADGRVQDIPWSQRISPPQGSSIDAAW